MLYDMTDTGYEFSLPHMIYDIIMMEIYNIKEQKKNPKLSPNSVNVTISSVILQIFNLFEVYIYIYKCQLGNYVY